MRICVASQGCKKCGSPRTCFVTKISAAFRSRAHRGTVCARSISSRGDLDRKLPIFRTRFTWPELFPWPNSVKREIFNFSTRTKMKSLFTWEKRKTKLSLPLSVVPFLLIVRFYGELRYTYISIQRPPDKQQKFPLQPRSLVKYSRSSNTSSHAHFLQEVRSRRKNPTLHFLLFPFPHDSEWSIPTEWHLHLVPLEERKERKNGGRGGKKGRNLYFTPSTCIQRNVGINGYCIIGARADAVRSRKGKRL